MTANEIDILKLMAWVCSIPSVAYTRLIRQNKAVLYEITREGQATTQFD